ncbi:MAG: helix-turn-helix domain-containing protein [Gemmatimonadales bacterium]
MEIKRFRDLGEQVRNRRKAVGLTADEVAASAGVSRRLVLELEQGKRVNVGFSNVLSILEALGLRIHVKPRGLPGIE